MKKLLIILLLIVGCAHKPPLATFYIGMTEEEFLKLNNINFNSNVDPIGDISGNYIRVDLLNNLNKTILNDSIKEINYKEENTFSDYWYRFVQDTLVSVYKGNLNLILSKEINYDKYATPPEWFAG